MNAYPLSWPAGWPRTAVCVRAAGRFSKRVQRQYGERREELSVFDGVQRVLAELERIGVGRENVIVSTNVPTRLDGLPRSGARAPDDPGAAVYWQDQAGARRVLAIDVYSRVSDNLAAIAATLEALRAVERHGGAKILERAFSGFTALASPGQSGSSTWRSVLGIAEGEPVSRDNVRRAYQRKAAAHHPDRGGEAALMAAINRAYEEALQEVAE